MDFKTRVWCYTSPFCWTVSGLCCISTELTPTTPPKYARKYPKRTPKYTQFNPPRSDNMLNTRVPVFQYPRFSFLFFFHTCTHMSNSPALHTCLSSEASHAILIANLLEHRSVPKTHPFSLPSWARAGVRIPEPEQCQRTTDQCERTTSTDVCHSFTDPHWHVATKLYATSH